MSRRKQGASGRSKRSQGGKAYFAAMGQRDGQQDVKYKSEVAFQPRFVAGAKSGLPIWACEAYVRGYDGQRYHHKVHHAQN